MSFKQLPKEDPSSKFKTNTSTIDNKLGFYLQL